MVSKKQVSTVRIALLISNLAGGGAERVVVNLANAFHRLGYAVEMVLLQAEGALLKELDPGIRVVDLKVNRVRGALWPLVKYLRHARLDAFLANIWPLTLMALWARTLARVPTRVIVAEHTTWSVSELLVRPTVGWQVRKSMQIFFPQAHGIVSVSQGAADDLARFSRLDRSSISVIYNPIVDFTKKPVMDVPLSPVDWCSGFHKRILAVGTLKEIKDYATLLNAFSILRKRVDARLLILGEGGCRVQLEAQAYHLGISNDVFMPGFVVDPTPYYQLADLHVLSSIGEGLPTVVIEALAAGTPVVSTDCPSGPREILVDGKYGVLVPVGDVPALADAMEASLLATHDRAALQMRAQDFSVDKAVGRYLELLVPRTASGSQI